METHTRRDAARRLDPTSRPSRRHHRRATARWLERTAASAHVRLYRILGGRFVGRGPGGVELLLLTTTGRRSGVTRTVPVGYVPHGTGVLITTGNTSGREPGWLHNLRAKPQAEVQIRRRRFSVTAADSATDNREVLWSALVAARPI